jgi:hypothetical protein
MTFYSRLNVLREHPDTARAGLKWTEEENAKLMQDVADGIDLNEVAKKHQRTFTGVKSRVMTNALAIMKLKDITLQEISKLVHISEDELKNHMQRQEDKAATPKVKNIVTKIDRSYHDDIIPYKDFMSILTQIRDYLKIICILFFFAILISFISFFNRIHIALRLKLL